MLTRISINNFKGISSFNTNELGKINLLIGKNDSGKSTIMEAGYFLFRELYSPPKLNEVMSRRTNLNTGPSELWYGYKTKSNIVVKATFDKLHLCWEISLSPSGPSYFNSTFHQMRLADSDNIMNIGTTSYTRGFSITQSSGRGRIENMQTDDKSKTALSIYASSLAFIDCTLKSKTDEIEAILGNIKISGNDAKFGEILNDIYGKGKEWEFIPHPENPSERRLTFKESGHLKYFSEFGDGLRCCVGILGTAISLENTALFVEEIESHQHSGSLSKMVRHLVTIARENNLQVFLSTHSMDVWESLHRGVYAENESKEKEEFRCFLIERNANTGEATAENTYDVHKITKALSGNS